MTRFDVAVVGAGSAGAVLAARLSEDPAVHVLLLEAGPDHTSADTPPGVRAANFLMAGEEPGRLWPSVVASRAAGQPERPYARGRGVGGSSAVNAMAAIRGTIDDYDRWADELGCPGWGWAEMLAAFLEAEDDVDYGGDALHGRGGPIPLARLAVEDRSPVDRAVRAALAELGYPACDDYHAADATGVSRLALTWRDGRRVSTNDAYLEAARSRPNLTVRGDELVDAVVVDGRRAVGVLAASGAMYEAGEVILCAGTIHSPAILLRSGIGVADGLAVGSNLKEHATAWFHMALNEDGRKRSIDGSLVRSVLRYSSGLFDAGPNDMQMVWFDAFGTSVDGLGAAALFSAVMRVFSHGELRLRGPEPFVDPIVEFRMLSDDRDRIRLHDAVRRMLDIVATPAVTAITTEVTALGRPVQALDSDGAIDAWLGAAVTDYVHAVGTCRMGTPGDPAAVVDTSCRVIGYDHLRVCDASVMPDLPKCNTHLTTVAMAERLAAMMRS